MRGLSPCPILGSAPQTWCPLRAQSWRRAEVQSCRLQQLRCPFHCPTHPPGQLSAVVKKACWHHLRVPPHLRMLNPAPFTFSVVRLQVRHLELPGREDLRKLQQLREEQGELSAGDEARLRRLQRGLEKDLLASADVVCTTCVGAGDPRLSNFRFRKVTPRSHVCWQVSRTQLHQSCIGFRVYYSQPPRRRWRPAAVRLLLPQSARRCRLGTEQNDLMATRVARKRCERPSSAIASGHLALFAQNPQALRCATRIKKQKTFNSQLIGKAQLNFKELIGKKSAFF